MDDILFVSQSLEEHQEHVRLVLQWLLENRLFVKTEKCEFHAMKVSFLSFIAGEGQLQTDRKGESSGRVAITEVLGVRKFLSVIHPCPSHLPCFSVEAGPQQRPLPLACSPPPSSAYMMRRLLDVHRRGRRFQYLVDWEGYGSEEQASISWALILDLDMMREFHNPNPTKPGGCREAPIGGGSWS